MKQTQMIVWIVPLFLLVSGEQSRADSEMLTSCKTCHAPGAERNGGPILVKQDEKYLFSQLKVFRRGERLVPAMNARLAHINDETLTNLAGYFAGLNPCLYSQIPPESLGGNVARGRALDISRSCLDCHSQGSFNAPRLMGQRTQSLIAGLKQFRDGGRPDNAGFMAEKAAGLTDIDIADVSAYFNSIPTCGK